jgi:protein SCO1/2
LPDLHFSLIAENGHAVTAEDYRGYTVLLYFGFTNCAAECPTTMARLANVVKRLGTDGQTLRILFVTVDPDRDTPPVLQKFVSSFDTVYINGLTGDKDEIGELARQYRAAYRRANQFAVSAKQREFIHSNAIYIFDKLGHARLLASDKDSDQALISDLHRLALGSD